MIETYTLYFDGACWPNPGPNAQYGYTLHKGGELLASVSSIVTEVGEKSNNTAEYAGLCAGLEDFLNRGVKECVYLQVFGDSQLVINQMNKNWKIREGLYYKKALQAVQLRNKLNKSYKLSFDWIPRERNEEADRLSKVNLEENGI